MEFERPEFQQSGARADRRGQPEGRKQMGLEIQSVDGGGRGGEVGGSSMPRSLSLRITRGRVGGNPANMHTFKAMLEGC